ncbi:DUF4102 domain-containing protein [Paraburkholderia dipogonis]|uniref:DUF4102 domain-containing protein n=1 Tax=Paraburkholderia dipogonis TaxID=1211383 RepID=A0A4Y8NCJ6_9BURK|nr:DUF4102 domain-containing protein [Paraburkholderia dipogonis]
MRGFGVKVTPQGSIACYYCYRLTQPNGRHGRKAIGHYPELAPSAAREPAKKRAGVVPEGVYAHTFRRTEANRATSSDRAVMRTPTVNRGVCHPTDL